MTDIEAVEVMAEKDPFLDTVSWLHLDTFAELIGNPNIQTETLRRRFRNALNLCAEQGKCRKRRIGLPIYQTGDIFGGRSCIMCEFV